MANETNPAQSTAVAEETADKSVSAQGETQAEETLDASDASTEGTAQNSTDAGEAEGKTPKGVQKKINKLTKRAAEAKRETEYWKEVALKSAQTKPGETSDRKVETVKADGKPKAEDYDSHAEYVEALTDWKYDQRKAADEIKQREASAKTEFQKSVETFQTKVKEFEKSHKDFQDVIADVDHIQMSSGVQECLLTSENGPELMYELAKDEELYERVNKLTPLAAARELGRIEARLAKEPSKQETKKQTSAPQPLKPVGGHASGGSKKSIYDADISLADYTRLRREASKRA